MSQECWERQVASGDVRELSELNYEQSLEHGWKEGINKALKIVLIVAVLG